MEIIIILIAIVLLFLLLKENKPKNINDIKQADTFTKTNIKSNKDQDKDNNRMISARKNKSNNKAEYSPNLGREKLDHDYQSDFNFMDRLNNEKEKKQLSYLKGVTQMGYFIVFQNKTYDQERSEGIL